MTAKSDWTRGSRKWVCGGCGVKLFAPPAVGSRTPVPCRCGRKAWTVPVGESDAAILKRLEARAARR